MSFTSELSTLARRDISRRARDAFSPMGIYIIRDKETGQVLVASSRNVHGAINRAQFELRLHSHVNKALQAAWNRSGPGRFDFEIVELLKEREDPGFNYDEELHTLEQIYREEFNQPTEAAR